MADACMQIVIGRLLSADLTLSMRGIAPDSHGLLAGLAGAKNGAGAGVEAVGRAVRAANRRETSAT